MISESFQEDVYIADFTDYKNEPKAEPVEFSGVTVGTEENGILPSFVFKNPNKVEFVVVNDEKNPAVFTRENGKKVSNCECIILTNRHDNRKGWMVFLELKYCKPQNVYDRMLEGINQLKATCNYILKEKKLFDSSQYKKYMVISTPGVTPRDPFDASYFDQDYMLTVKEDTGANLKAANIAFVQTPAVISFE